MNFTIREARHSDACDIASVHVRSWRETYAGIISNEYLCGLSIEGRSKVWRSILSGDNPKQHTYVAEVEGAIVGFCNGGPARERERGFDRELYAIYLLRSYQGLGIGKAMFNVFKELLKGDSTLSFYLWVLRDNPTGIFYECSGGIRGTQKTIEIGGKELVEDLYYWQGS